MPLGIQQNNNLQHLTLDVWQDQIFLNGVTYPAGYFAAKNTNQNHYCGTAPQSIEEYIAQQPEHTQLYLRQINEVIQSALPDAVQKISWSMPTYWKKRNLIQFAASKKHIGLYPGPAAVDAFANRLQGYKTSKGTIQFPYDKPLPLEIIREIVAWCGAE